MKTLLEFVGASTFQNQVKFSSKSPENNNGNLLQFFIKDVFKISALSN